MLITASGVIGCGKSSLTKILSEDLGSKAFYEPVKDNPVLPLFYEGNKRVEEGLAKTNPYAFLLQIYFLNMRFKSIKEAMQEDNNVLDRSIYEDSIFMKMNYEQGHTSKVEWDIYKNLFDNMMEELPYASHKKAPDLMIYIDVNYDTMLKRIAKRGRRYEQVKEDSSLASYYKDLIDRYKDWVSTYAISPLLVIDGNCTDFVGNEENRQNVLDKVESKLVQLGSLSQERFDAIKAKRNKEMNAYV